MKKEIEILIERRNRPLKRVIKFFHDKIYDNKINNILDEMSLLELFKLKNENENENIINKLSESNKKIILNSLIKQPHPEKKKYEHNILELINLEELNFALSIFNPPELKEYFKSKDSYLFTFMDFDILNNYVKSYNFENYEKFLNGISDIIFDPNNKYREKINEIYGFYRGEEETYRHNVIFSLIPFINSDEIIRKWNNVDTLINHMSAFHISSVHIKSDIFWHNEINRKHPEFYEELLKHKVGKNILFKSYNESYKYSDGKGIICVCNDFKDKSIVEKYFKDIENCIGDLNLGFEAFYEHREDEYVIPHSELINRLLKYNNKINEEGLLSFIEIVDPLLNKDIKYPTDKFSYYIESYSKSLLNFGFDRENKKLPNSFFEEIIKKDKERKVDSSEEIEKILFYWLKNITNVETIEKIKKYADEYDINKKMIFSKYSEMIRIESTLPKEEIYNILLVLRKETEKNLASIFDFDDIILSINKDNKTGDFESKTKNIWDALIKFISEEDSSMKDLLSLNMLKFETDDLGLILKENKDILGDMMLNDLIPLKVTEEILNKSKIDGYIINEIKTKKEKKYIFNNLSDEKTYSIKRKRI